MVVAGTIEDFDQDAQDQFIANLASSTGVQTEHIELVITEGSINVTAHVTTPSDGSVSTEAITSALSNSDTITAALSAAGSNFALLHHESPTTTTTVVFSPTLSPPSSPDKQRDEGNGSGAAVGATIAALLFATLLAGAAFFFYRKKYEASKQVVEITKESTTKAETTASDESTTKAETSSRDVPNETEAPATDVETAKDNVDAENGSVQVPETPPSPKQEPIALESVDVVAPEEVKDGNADIAAN